MARYYSPQEKSAVLSRLAENGGSIALTAFQMNIPERTLRDWRRREIWIASQPLRASQPEAASSSPSSSAAAATAATISPPPPDLTEFKDDLAALGFMRHQIMNDLLALSTQTSSSFAFMTPYQRATMITRLIDRLMKLDQHLHPYTPQVTTVRVVREDKPKPHWFSDQTVGANHEDTMLKANLWIEVANSTYGPFPLSELDDKIAFYQGLGLDPRIVTHPSEETVISSESE